MNTECNESTKEIELPDRFASASKLALSAYGRLRNMSITDRKLVYAALVARFDGGKPDRRMVSASAIQRYVDDIGEVPSAQRFESWRLRQVDCVSIPSVTFIRNTFSNWANAVAEFKDEAVLDVKRARLIGRQPSFSHEEIIGCVGRWLQSHRVEWVGGTPRLAAGHLVPGDRPVTISAGWHAKLGSRNYRDWLMRMRASGESLPLPELVADRLGGWPIAARHAIERIDDDVFRAVLHDARLTADERRSEFVVLLQEAAPHLRQPIARPAFDRWVERRAVRVGDYERTLLKLRTSEWALVSFRSWSEALRHAGLKPDSTHLYGAAIPTRDFSRPELVEFAREARESVGELNFTSYGRWRRGAALISPGRPIPTARWMRSALGDWNEINRLAEAAEGVSE